VIIRACLCVVVVASVLGAAAPAFAQRGRSIVPPGQSRKVQQSSATSAGLASAETGVVGVDGGVRVRALGAWLDDATVAPRGEVWMALSASRWALPVASGAEAPVIDLSVGIARRVQASVSVPYSRAVPAAGVTTGGIGDIFVTTKVVMRDAADGVGVAVAPVIEMLGRSSIEGTGVRRANWVLPVNIERRFRAGRVYGSTGLFSRGAFFVSGAVERYVSDTWSLSGAVTHSHSTDMEALSEELGLGRRRMDVSGTAAYTVSPAMAVFGSVGRTVWGRDADSTRLIASGGVSVKVR
jgi:hypothetical protein